MRRLHGIVAVVIFILGGAGIASATGQHVTMQDAASQNVCATPMASPGATPEVSPPPSGATPSPGATPDQAGRFAILSDCSTPAVSTPAP